MDPKDMSDDQLDEAINSNPNEPDVPADNPSDDETPPQDQSEPNRGPDGRFKPKSEEQKPDETPPAEDEPQVNPDEEKPPSRREQLRIQQVLERVKAGQQRQTQEPQRTPPRQGALDYATELDADPEVIARLEEDRRLAEQARYEEGLKQAQGYEWRTLLHVDAPQVERDHPQLDKNSPDFHPALANSLSQMYLQMSGFDEQTGFAANPGMRWSEFISSFWELADEIAKVEGQSSAQRIAKQAAQTGLRPNGEATKLNLNKAPEHMTDAELDAFLAQQGLAPAKRR